MPPQGPLPRLHLAVLFALFLVAASGFVLQAWANEAWFAPMLELIRKIG